MKMNERYTAVFQKDQEANGYTVFFPDLPGCVTEGDGYPQALRMAKEALELHLYGMKQDGDEMPVATDPRNIALEHGQILISIQTAEEDDLSFVAIFNFAEDGVSVRFPDLPGCLTCGDDFEEALRNAKEALGSHLLGMKRDGDEIPMASNPEELEVERGELLVIVSDSTH